MLFHDFIILFLKTTYGHLNMRDQNHGRSNKLSIEIIIWYNKTNNDDPSGNRLSICPLRFRIASPKISIDLSCASVNRNSWGGNTESLGAKRSAYYPRDQSLFVYYRVKWNWNIIGFHNWTRFVLIFCRSLRFLCES